MHTPMAHSSDPRGRRTREALHRALLAIMEEKPVAQITVSELCRGAAIHRTTFYKHYSDVPDFVGQAFAGIVDDLIGVPLNSRFGYDETPGIYRAAAVRVFTAVVRDRRVYRRLLGPEGDVTSQRAMLNGLVARFTSAAENCLRFTSAPIDPRIGGAAIAGATMMAAERLAFSDTRDVDAAVDAWLDCLPGWFVGGWGNRPGDAMYSDRRAALTS